MAAVEANGITIEYEISGAGTPLLLVMGLGGQLTSWPPGFVDLLVERGFQVIRFDNRDSGLSTIHDGPAPTRRQTFLASVLRRRTDVPYRLTDMADDAAGLLRALGVGPAHVVGMSMGGMIAQTLTLAHPELVRSLTSVMSNTGNRRGGTAPSLLAKLPRLITEDRDQAVEKSVALFRAIGGDEFDEATHRESAKADVARSYQAEGTARQTAAIMAGPDRTELLSAITAPTLVIHGLADPLVLPSGGIATAEAIRESRLLMFPGMGHSLPPSRWEEIVDAIVTNAERAAPVTATG